MYILMTLILSAAVGGAPDETRTVRTELTEVVSRPLQKTTLLTGELRPFQTVDIHARVSGFIEEIHVDRGSRVRKGQLLARMSAPEVEAQRAEVEAKIPAVRARQIEVEARLAAEQSTYERLKEAAKTPGVVAGNDLVVAEKTIEAQEAAIESLELTIQAYEASVRTINEMEKYLQVTAPSDGVVTLRNAHVGALAGPESASQQPLFTVEQVHRLRLVVAVPEAYLQSVVRGREISFTVPAYPGETFKGKVSRPAYAVSPETRTMPVEADIENVSNQLAPGMYATVSWLLQRKSDSLFVPPGAIKSTTERIFVIRVRDGRAEWVDVRRGETQGNMVEVFGSLQSGDLIVARATDEIRPGTTVEPL